MQSIIKYWNEINIDTFCPKNSMNEPTQPVFDNLVQFASTHQVVQHIYFFLLNHHSKSTRTSTKALPIEVALTPIT